MAKKPPELLQWLTVAPTGSAITSVFDYHSVPAPLPHLTTLDIGMASVSPTNLFKILTRFQLESFNLWKVNLATGRDVDLTSDPTTNPAAEFFSQLADWMKSSSLHRAMIGFMTIDSNKDDRFNSVYPVDFPKSRDEYQIDTKKQISDTVCRTIKFGGGAAATFADWAREMADRATCLRIKGPLRDRYVDASDMQDDPGSDVPFSDEEIDDNEDDEEELDDDDDD